MPTLPLPVISPIGGGDLPISNENDVFAILPAFVKASDPAPVRDAIVAALTAMMFKYQELSSEAVAYADVLRSLDSALIGLAEDRGIFIGQDESFEELRLRILNIPDLVTPTAIVAAVNTILEPHTPIPCQYSESVQDRWYVGSGTRPWHSYVWNETSSMSPGYPDRLYEDDAAANLGYFRPNSNPGGARVYRDTSGRLFMIRIPDLSGIDNLGAFSNSGDTISRFYVGGVGISSPIRAIGTTVIDTFNYIVSTVYRLKGNGIRFQIYMDPKLR